MKTKRNNFISVSGIAIIWLLWFILSNLDMLMENYRMIDLVGFILLFLIVLTPLFFGIFLNLYRGIIIGFFGTLIPAIFFLNSNMGTISLFFAIIVLSMSSSLLKLINSNARQEELIILRQELKNIRSFYVITEDLARKHTILTSLILAIVGGLIAYLIIIIL